MFCGIHLRALSQELLTNLIDNIFSKIALLKLQSHLPGANELTGGFRDSLVIHELDSENGSIIIYLFHCPYFVPILSRKWHVFLTLAFLVATDDLCCECQTLGINWVQLRREVVDTKPQTDVGDTTTTTTRRMITTICMKTGPHFNIKTNLSRYMYILSPIIRYNCLISIMGIPILVLDGISIYWDALQETTFVTQ